MGPNNVEEIAIDGGITPETCNGVEDGNSAAEELRNLVTDMLEEPVGGR